MPSEDPAVEITRERWQLLRQLDRMLEMPMVVLGFVWLALLVFELTGRLPRVWSRDCRRLSQEPRGGT